MKRLNVKQTEFGRSVAFTMRPFRFTSTATAGDNNDQQQNISCDIKLLSCSSESCRQPHFMVEGTGNYWSGTGGCHDSSQCPIACPDLRTTLTAQMPPCDCFTEDECIAQRKNFTLEPCGKIIENYSGDGKCDGGVNMCHYRDNVLCTCDYNRDACGLCENCQNLKTAQDCQVGVR